MITAVYRKYTSALARRQEIANRQPGDASADADAVAVELERIWPLLSQEEQTSARWIGSALSSFLCPATRTTEEDFFAWGGMINNVLYMAEPEHGDIRPRPGLVDSVVDWFQKLRTCATPPWRVSLLKSGTIQIEWHHYAENVFVEDVVVDVREYGRGEFSIRPMLRGIDKNVLSLTYIQW